ncbi:unnamed protein product [Effrenium voratum]|uniref:Uncharacterized protein n=1 Tax=Effrenium voratum TaxID=2562239 RepID=A0AA36JSW5_9DINO|nr:unnamed protein product [Effrenium voratum]
MSRARSESPLMEDYGSLNRLNSARSNPLFDAARARKQAEQDSILLANRIRLLRNEEAKTKRKIAETERKTQEIVQSRRRNELRRQEKEAFEAQKEAMESEFRAKQILEREDQQHKIQDQMRRIQEKNRSGGRVQRQQRQAHRQILDLEKQAAADEAFARAEQVRAAMDRAARSRARSEGAKQELAKDVIRERMVREEDERRQRVSEIERMEREEAELMERLRRSQERHRMAYMQLEDVLRQGSVQSLSMSPSEFQMANVFEAMEQCCFDCQRHAQLALAQLGSRTRRTWAMASLPNLLEDARPAKTVEEPRTDSDSLQARRAQFRSGGEKLSLHCQSHPAETVGVTDLWNLNCPDPDSRKHSLSQFSLPTCALPSLETCKTG